ncbi:MAG: hypothetical protein JRN68_05690 [Nitrososphaerota archaeon]|nr:hypothetical protein [Nitrososphaerota archaeon]
MRLYWLTVAMLCINLGFFLVDSSLGIGGVSISQTFGQSVQPDTGFIGFVNSSAQSLNQSETHTILGQLASTFYIFGDIIGGIRFGLYFFGQLFFAVPATLADLGAPTAWITAASVVTATLYVSAIVEIMRAVKVE